MIFYVYFDPQIISAACANGAIGVQLLIGILRALSQNCFLADFKNYGYTQEEIGNQLKNIVGDFDVKELKVLLAHFDKEHLFIECLDYDYTVGVSELEMVQNQCVEALLDLLLLADDAFIRNDVPVEIATLMNYQASSFEPARSNLAKYGIMLGPGSLDGKDFLEKFLKKALKYAQSIEIFDYLCGEKYKGNYDKTLKNFLGWLETVNAEDLTITLHCGYPESGLDIYPDEEGLSAEEIGRLSRRNLSDKINSHYGKSEIRVNCYDEKFAHDRFVVTNQIAFSIGVGMDFISSRGKIRDISINLKDAQKVKSLLSEM